MNEHVHETMCEILNIFAIPLPVPPYDDGGDAV